MSPQRNFDLMCCKSPWGCKKVRAGFSQKGLDLF